MIHIRTRWTIKQFPKPSQLWRGIVSGLLLSLLVSVPCATAQVALKVEWKEERLSILAERAPLSQVLQEVAKQTGVKFRGLDVPQENVSLNFSHLPLLEGLRRLLAQVNYVIIEERSMPGAMLPAQAVILGRLAPLTSETTPSEEAEQIKEEQTVVEVSPDQEGVPREDEQTAAMMSRNQRSMPLKGGVPLEDEQTAAMMSRDQRSMPLKGGVPLEDEQTAAMMNPDQGGVPLEDEQTAGVMSPHK
jgi:type II secretory pathway component GspD/PulD (secretin)